MVWVKTHIVLFKDLGLRSLCQEIDFEQACSKVRQMHICEVS